MTPRATSQASAFSLVGRPDAANTSSRGGGPSDEQLPSAARGRRGQGSRSATSSPRVAPRGPARSGRPAQGRRRMARSTASSTRVSASRRSAARRELAHGSDEQQIRATLTAARRALAHEQYARACNARQPGRRGADPDRRRGGLSGGGIVRRTPCARSSRSIDTTNGGSRAPWPRASPSPLRRCGSAPRARRSTSPGSRSSISPGSTGAGSSIRSSTRGWPRTTTSAAGDGRARRSPPAPTTCASLAGTDEEPGSLTDLSRVLGQGRQLAHRSTRWARTASRPRSRTSIADPSIVPRRRVRAQRQAHEGVVVKARSCGPAA